MAVSALSGCTTVEPRTTPRPDGSAELRVVQAPAREALEMVGPSRHPKHREAPASHRLAPAPPVTHQPPAPAPPARTRPLPDHHRRPHTGGPHVASPDPKVPDVCALGKGYGGWGGDSPEAVICEQVYGH